MASRFLQIFEKDMELFMQEFAVEATLVCEDSEYQAKVVFMDMPRDGEVEQNEIVIQIPKKDLRCNKPKIVCEYGSLHTLYFRDDKSGIVELVVSKDEPKKVEIL